MSGATSGAPSVSELLLLVAGSPQYDELVTLIDSAGTSRAKREARPPLPARASGAAAARGRAVGSQAKRGRAGWQPASPTATRPARHCLCRRATQLGDRGGPCNGSSTARAARPRLYLLGAGGGRLRGWPQLVERDGSGGGGVAGTSAGTPRLAALRVRR